MAKPEFDPSQPFQSAAANAPAKPEFDPTKSFDTPKSATQDIPMIKSYATGAADTISGGLVDELDAATPFNGGNMMGGLKTLAGHLPGVNIDPNDSDVQEYKAARDKNRIQNAADIAANPKSALAGQIVGAFTPGGEVMKGGSTAAKLGKATVMGGAAGYGHSDSDDGTQQAIDTAKGAGIGLGVGTAGQIVGKGLNALSSSSLADTAENRAVKALGISQSQYKSLLRKQLAAAQNVAENDIPDEAVEHAAKLSPVNQLGRDALDNKVITPFSNAEDQLEASSSLNRKSGQKIGQTLDKFDGQLPTADEATLSKYPNTKDIAAKAEYELGSRYRNEPLTADKAKQLDTVISSLKQKGDGPISFSQMQTLKQNLGEEAFDQYGRVIPGKEVQAKVFQYVKNAMEKSADALTPESERGAYQEAKRLYGNSLTMQDASLSKSAKEAVNRTISPSDYISAATASHAGGPAAIGTALVNKGLRTYGNQMIATGADAVSKVLAKSPDVLGKYASTLTQALQKGPAAFAATNAVLQRNDPEYSALVQKINQDNN